MVMRVHVGACGYYLVVVVGKVADQHLPKADKIVLRKQRLSSLLAFDFDDAHVL